MINKDIIEAFSALAKEKNLDRINLSSIIEDILLTMLHKKYGEERENFSVIVNMDKGEIEIYQEKVIVENVTDPVEEILLSDAQKVEPALGIGDHYNQRKLAINKISLSPDKMTVRLHIPELKPTWGMSIKYSAIEFLLCQMV